MSFSSPPSSSHYRPLQPPPKDFSTTSSSPNAGPADGPSSFDAPSIHFPSVPPNIAKTIQRPLHRLRNDEITAVRHQIPAVYEALVQYDSLYLNAEARMEAKENELTRCIEVGQEVLMQLNAVRQRCSEISDERDAAMEGRNALERQLNLLRQNVKVMEQSYEDHYRSSSTEAAQSNMQLQYELRQQKDINASLNAQVSDLKDDLGEMNLRCAQLEQDRAEFEAENSHLRESTMAHTRQSRDDVAEVASCGALCGGISTALGSCLEHSSSAGGQININTLPEMRSCLQDLHRRTAIVRENFLMERSKREQLEISLDAVKQEKEYAVSEANALRSNLVQLRDGCTQLQSEMQRLKDEKMESPKRLQMLQASVEDKDRSLQDAQRALSNVQLELASKSQRVIQLEQHIHELQQDLQHHQEQVDHASRAAEAMHRARLGEQTIAQLQAEVTKHKGKAQQLAEVESLLEENVQKCRDWAQQCESLKQAGRELQEQLLTKQSDIDGLSETLSAVQSDLYETQCQKTRIVEELSKAQSVTRDLETELKKIKSNASVGVELKASREENAHLRDALERIQKESRELNDALSRVAQEEQQTSTTMITRMQTLEADLEEKNRKCSEHSVHERQLKQQLREASIKETQLHEIVEVQKKRIADLLHNQVPKLMFEELENDYSSIRDDLQKVREENMTLQELVDQHKKQTGSWEVEYSNESRRNADVLHIVQQWDERLKHLEQHQCAGGPMIASKRLERHRSVRGTNTSTKSSSGSTQRPLFLDLSLGAGGGDSPPSLGVLETSSTSIDAAPGALVQYSSSARKLLDAFADSTAEQRKLLHVIQERLKSRRTLPPDSVLYASTPQTYVDSVARWYDISLQQLDSLVLQANKVAETKTAKATHLEDELSRCQQRLDELHEANATLTRELDARQTSLASAEAELGNIRARAQRLADDKVALSAEAERDRTRRSKLEHQLAEYERQLEEVHSSVSFESKSLAARCETLKQTLESERSEHQLAIKKVFEEMSQLKQDRVRNQSASHDEYAAEVKRRRVAESERDDLTNKLHHTERVNEELEERLERYASMLQVAREEVENVTATLNDVEANLQKDLKAAEEDKEALQSELQHQTFKLQEAQADLQRAHAAAQEAKSSQVEDAAVQQRIASLRRDLDVSKGRLEESQHVIAALEERCRLQQEELDRAALGEESEARELAALREANEALEHRLRAVENDRDPLRLQLHTLLNQQQRYTSNFLESASPSPSGSATKRLR